MDDLTCSNERMKELLFLDLLEHGFYVAQRGFIALSTAVSEDDLDRFIATLDTILSARASVFREPEPEFAQ